MCGRFISLTKQSVLKKKFNIKDVDFDNLISYNIAPSQKSNIIFKNKNISLDQASWGYSFFDKKENIEKNIINSRLETINKKILFKDSYYNRKCIIPLNGYYEWSIIDNKKIPFFINIPESEPMYMAGIWKYINYNLNYKKVFTVITKSANKNLSKIHNRMPVLLSFEEIFFYLEDKDSSFLNKKFVSDIESDLDFYSVSNYVNNPLNNSEECIKQI